MEKANPLMRLVKKKRKKAKTSVRKGDFVCPYCGREFDDIDDYREHLISEREKRNRNYEDEDDYEDEDEDFYEGEEEKMIKEADVRKMIHDAVRRELRKAEEDFKDDEFVDDDDDFEEEEEEEDMHLDREILDKLNEIEEKLSKILDERAPIEEDDEFEDADEEKAVRAKKEVKPISKKEQKHKPKVEDRDVSTGESDREVEEDNFEDFEEQGDESPERASKEELEARKANYKNVYQKPKELPEKAQLSQKVKFNDTIPSESSFASTTNKQVATGKAPDVASAYTSEDYAKFNGAGEDTPIAKVLLGKSKASDVMRDIRKSMKNSDSVFGEYGSITGV